VGDGRLMVVLDGKLEPVWKSQVAEYVDEHFWSVVDVWNRWKTLGMMPFSGGWAEQPAHLVEAIETAEAAYVEAERQQRKSDGR